MIVLIMFPTIPTLLASSNNQWWSLKPIKPAQHMRQHLNMRLIKVAKSWSLLQGRHVDIKPAAKL
jgi:hypothetical protein